MTGVLWQMNNGSAVPFGHCLNPSSYRPVTLCFDGAWLLIQTKILLRGWGEVESESFLDGKLNSTYINLLKKVKVGVIKNTT